MLLALSPTGLFAAPPSGSSSAASQLSRPVAPVAPVAPSLQTDIPGPAGSGSFGEGVTVLPNGNIVVVDTLYDEGGANDIGAVYLYDGATLSIISTLKGSTLNDQVGSGGVKVLTNGHYVVSSYLWDNPTGSVADVGAVTWCSATAGCNGNVSPSNSLVGGTLNDQVGYGGVTALTNGHYVVRSPLWDNPSPATADAGAATWGNGVGGTVGAVSSANSVLGTVPNGISAFSYDYVRSRLVVGRGASNVVSILFYPAPPTSTNTIVPAGTPTATATACPIEFQDVPSNYTFYSVVRCLACKGIISGYPCGGEGEPCEAGNKPYFRPSVQISRGQIAKIVSQSANLNDPPGARIFEDVPEDSPFFPFIQRLTNEGHMGGYPCGQVDAEPCVTGNRGYFRPSNNATRGQLSKIVSNAAGINDPVTGQTYEDVAGDSPFYLFIERLSALAVMSGYPCGGAGEACGAGNKPYFRPNSPVTRGQASKIVANTFFPNCQTSAKPQPDLSGSGIRLQLRSVSIL